MDTSTGIDVVSSIAGGFVIVRSSLYLPQFLPALRLALVASSQILCPCIIDMYARLSRRIQLSVINLDSSSLKGAFGDVPVPTFKTRSGCALLFHAANSANAIIRGLFAKTPASWNVPRP